MCSPLGAGARDVAKALAFVQRRRPRLRGTFNRKRISLILRNVKSTRLGTQVVLRQSLLAT